MIMNNFTWNLKAPLERAKGVGRRANQALRDYAMMGTGRSLRKLLKRYRGQKADNPQTELPTVKWGTLSGWSCKYDWVARVDAWTAIKQEEEETEWKERQRQIRQQDWSHGQQLREMAAKILEAAPAFIKRRERIEQGEPDAQGHRVDTKIITVALDGHLLTKLEKLASDLSRRAAKMEKDIITVTTEEIPADDILIKLFLEVEHRISGM